MTALPALGAPPSADGDRAAAKVAGAEGNAAKPPPPPPPPPSGAAPPLLSALAERLLRQGGQCRTLALSTVDVGAAEARTLVELLRVHRELTSLDMGASATGGAQVEEASGAVLLAVSETSTATYSKAVALAIAAARDAGVDFDTTPVILSVNGIGTADITDLGASSAAAAAPDHPGPWDRWEVR